MWVVRVPSGRIWIGCRNNGGSSDNTGRVGVAMVNQDTIAELHQVSHKIAGLVVSHSVPASRLVLGGGQVIDGENVRLRLHQPESLLAFLHRLDVFSEGQARSETGMPRMLLSNWR